MVCPRPSEGYDLPGCPPTDRPTEVLASSFTVTTTERGERPANTVYPVAAYPSTPHDPCSTYETAVDLYGAQWGETI
jgi:hypothetical protein